MNHAMNGSKLRDNNKQIAMIISELIATLQVRLEKHGDVTVVTTWEGITVKIDPSSIYLSKDGSLFIDADGNSYKNEFAVDPSEN